MSYVGAMNRVIDVGRREVKLSRGSLDLIGVSVFIILTAAGAFVRIPLPFTPVPVTLQTFFVLLSGALLGRRLGAASQAGYVLLGALGLPIFTGAAGGIAKLMGPTGGYLIGFIAASFVISFLLKGKEDAGLIKIVSAMTLGNLIILLMGTAWLNIILGIGMQKALLIGFLPFVPGDIFKLACAAALFIVIRQRARQIYPNN